MHYKSFAVSNFKGIQRLEFRLDDPREGRIHTLVGLNESGKTTVLEAIDRFGRNVDSDRIRSVSNALRANENDLVPISRRMNFNDDVTISAIVRLSSGDKIGLKNEAAGAGYDLRGLPDEVEITDTYKFEKSLYKSGARRVNLTGEVKTKRARKWIDLESSAPGDIRRTLWRKTSAMLPPIWYFPNFLFDFPERIYLEPQPTEKPADLFYRDILGEIVRKVDASATLEEHLAARAQSDDMAESRAMDELVLQMSRLLTSEVFGSWKKILGRDEGMRVILTVDNDAPAGGVARNPYLRVAIEGSDGYFALSDRSLGFRWFFVFLLLTTFPGLHDAKNSGEMLFLLDEPASNLHPTAQAQLLSSLEKLSQRSRVVYSTHSHHLVNPDWLEHTHVVRNSAMDPGKTGIEGNASETNIHVDPYRAFASQHPDQSRYFQPVLDVLQYQPSRLELVPELIFVEGKNDYYTLRLFQRFLKDESLCFYPGGGAGSLDVPVGLYLAWSRNFLILLDSDGEGLRQSTRYKDRFGPLVEPRVKSLADLLPDLSGSAMEGVLAREDWQAIAECVGDDSLPRTKKERNACISRAVMAHVVPPFSDDTLVRLRAMFDALQRLLVNGR